MIAENAVDFARLSYVDQFSELIQIVVFAIIVAGALYVSKRKKYQTSLIWVALIFLVCGQLVRTGLEFMDNSAAWEFNLDGSLLSLFPLSALMIGSLKNAPFWFRANAYVVAALGCGSLLIYMLHFFPKYPYELGGLVNSYLQGGLVMLFNLLLFIGLLCWYGWGKIRRNPVQLTNIDDVLISTLKFCGVVTVMLLCLTATGYFGLVPISD